MVRKKRHFLTNSSSGSSCWISGNGASAGGVIAGSWSKGPWDTQSSTEIEAGPGCVGSILITPWRGCTELAVPVKKLGNGRWWAANISWLWWIISCDAQIWLTFSQVLAYICRKHFSCDIELILSISWLIPFTCKSFIIKLSSQSITIKFIFVIHIYIQQSVSPSKKLSHMPWTA